MGYTQTVYEQYTNLLCRVHDDDDDDDDEIAR
jgi:hypothetical protein